MLCVAKPTFKEENVLFWNTAAAFRLETELSQAEDLYDAWLGTEMPILGTGDSAWLILSIEWNPSLLFLGGQRYGQIRASWNEASSPVHLPLGWARALSALPRLPLLFSPAHLLVLVSSPKSSGLSFTSASHVCFNYFNSLLTSFSTFNPIWKSMLYSAFRE